MKGLLRHYRINGQKTQDRTIWASLRLTGFGGMYPIVSFDFTRFDKILRIHGFRKRKGVCREIDAGTHVEGTLNSPRFSSSDTCRRYNPEIDGDCLSREIGNSAAFCSGPIKPKRQVRAVHSSNHIRTQTRADIPGLRTVRRDCDATSHRCGAEWDRERPTQDRAD